MGNVRTVTKQDTPLDTSVVADSPEVDPASAPPQRKRWPWLAGLAVLAIVAAVVAMQMSRSDVPEVEPVALNTAEVVIADLVEVDTLDGTLGRVEEEPIPAAGPGVVTYLPAEGDVIDNGDVLYRIEADPAILLRGPAPAYRDIGLASGESPAVPPGPGTITAMPEVGTVIQQGDVIYEIDGEPVVALYGESPAYRTLRDLSDDMEGSDIAQFEEALNALGYSGFTVDDVYSDATENAVEDWQEDIGATVDGVVDLGEVVFIPGPSLVVATTNVGTQVAGGQPAVTLATEPLTPGPDVLQLEAALTALGFGDGLTVDDEFTLETRDAVLAWQESVGAATDGIVDLGEILFSENALRVSDQLVAVGSQVTNGSPMLAVAGSDIVVKIDLPADDQGLVAVGDSVTVELPGQVNVAGTVESVASVASIGQTGEATFEVVVTLDDPSAASGLDEAPVDVEIVADSVTDVLAVPVSALVALAEGGYAVEVAQSDGSTTLVAVDPGFYADGLVEVTGAALDPGMLVVVP